MDRESQELIAHSPSWPPGLFVGSVVLEAGARSRRRDGFMLIALAVCSWCLGYAITDRCCASNPQKPLAASASQAELAALAQNRSLKALSVASEPVPAAEPVANAEPAVEATAIVNTQKRAANPRAGANASQRRVRATPASEHVLRLTTEEPSPMVTPAELSQVLARAAATKRIFASVDEAAQAVAPKPVAVVQQPAAAAVELSGEANVVAIEALYVEGGVPPSVVNRGVQRLLPQYDRCREFCDSAPQRMKLSTTIDEAGRGRRVTVEGLSRPQLRRCLEQATSHLVVPAPDTGTARARWIVRFAGR